MPDLQKNLYSVEQIRKLEAALINEFHVPGYDLMKRAGQALFQRCQSMLDGAGRVLVLCGPGNNAGDGYVAAGLLQQTGFSVELISLTDPRLLRNEAAQAKQDWLTGGGEIQVFSGELPAGFDLILDALLGIGLERPLRGDFLLAVQLMNEYLAPILAVDIPSGLSSESGRPLNLAVRADHTLTFIGLKTGLFCGGGPDYCGQIELCDLDAPSELFNTLKPDAQRLSDALLSRVLPKRPRDSHKGSFGHVLVVGGDKGMSGAVRLAGTAAVRVGAGLVSVATRSEHAAGISAGFPVLMSRGIDSTDELRDLIIKASVVAIGPGLGQKEWGQRCWDVISEIEAPLVVDADALNLLAQNPKRRDNWILTPHPGEAATLLETTTTEVQANRLGAVKSIQKRYGGVAVLKGASSLIADGSDVTLCERGNPGMASGGMGDVLTGAIVGLMAQNLSLSEAAQTGVWIHAVAGDLAAGEQPRGLAATDLFPHLRSCVNR